MKKILIFLILAIVIISVSIGYRSITLGEGVLEVKGGFIRENNVIWSKSPSMMLNINNNSILPKKIEIIVLNIKKGSMLQSKDKEKLINPNEKIVLNLPPLSRNSYVTNYPTLIS